MTDTTPSRVVDGAQVEAEMADNILFELGKRVEPDLTREQFEAKKVSEPGYEEIVGDIRRAVSTVLLARPHRTPTPEIDGLIGEMKAGLEGVTPFTDADLMRYEQGGGRLAIINDTTRKLIADFYSEDDREHFARCSPDNIAKLLAHISALEERLARAGDVIRPFANAEDTKLDDLIAIRAFLKEISNDEA